jgi:capsid portal protein
MCSKVGNRRVFFKEYGDPRMIDPTNGEVMKQQGQGRAGSVGDRSHSPVHL